jgi:hypothetical protein
VAAQPHAGISYWDMSQVQLAKDRAVAREAAGNGAK